MNIRFLLLSLSAHLVCLAAMLLQFTHKNAGLPPAEASIMRVVSVKETLPSPPLIAPHGLIKKNTAHKQPSSASPFPTYASRPIEQRASTLLTLLHHAIAANQVYPEQALNLNQTGMVRVQFMLNPEGQMSQLALLKSSGYPLLDQAALTAVAGVAPFRSAKDYLETTQHFTIDVIFS